MCEKEEHWDRDLCPYYGGPAPYCLLEEEAWWERRRRDEKASANHQLQRIVGQAEVRKS